MRVRVVGWALLGALLGIAVNAWGQDMPNTQVDPSSLLWLQLVRDGGLPAVLALTAVLLARGVPVRVSLSDEDRAMLRRLGGPDG